MRSGGVPWPGKRVQCNMGAKNHGVIMPDANKEYTINQLVGAAFGAAGQRCMALSTAVLVGESREGLPEVSGRPRPSPGGAPGGKPPAGRRPRPRHRPAARHLPGGQGADLRARPVGGGRGRRAAAGRPPGAAARPALPQAAVPEYPQGNFVGPTIITSMNKGMKAYHEEIFGPVLCVVLVDTLDEVTISI